MSARRSASRGPRATWFLPRRFATRSAASARARQLFAESAGSNTVTPRLTVTPASGERASFVPATANRARSAAEDAPSTS